MRIFHPLLLVAVFVIFVSCVDNKMPRLKKYFMDVKISTSNNKLEVDNSIIKRVCKITEYGLVTESITNQNTGKVWTNPESKQSCDWSYSIRKKSNKLRSQSE